MAGARRTAVDSASPVRGPVTRPTVPGPRASGAGDLPNALLLVLAALSACITAQGGYYAGGQLATGVLLAVALLSALRTRPLSMDDLRSPPFSASAGLAAWAAVVAVTVGGEALPVLGLLAGICVVLLVCRRTSDGARDGLAVALLGIGVLVALSGWIGVAWRFDPLALEDQGLWRAATTLTYANAAAGLLVPLALLALGRQLGRRSPAGAAATCLLLAGAGATLSRGGATALLAGVVCLAAMAGARRTAQASGGPLAGAVVALVGLAPSMPAATDPRPALAVLSLGAGVFLTLALHRAPARSRTVAFGAIALGAVLLLTLGPLAGTRRSVSAARLTLASEDRRAETAAALRLAADHPLTGAGPGQATLFLNGPDGQPLAARYAHNEYLQILAELGAVGLALTVALLVALARSVRAGREAARSPQLWAGAASGLVALGVHSGFDFLWHVPALPLAGAVLVGLTIQAAPTTKEHE